MFSITDVNELSALHKAILEAKFSVTPQNEEIAASPVLAQVSNRLYDELCRMQEKKKSGVGLLWQEWRRIKNGDSYRGFFYDAVINARKDFIFLESDDDAKRTIAKCYLSPFTCLESEIDEFIEEVEKNKAGSLSSLDCGIFKNAVLMKTVVVDEDTVELKLWLSNKKLCDIVFYGVTRFEIKSEGKRNNMPLNLTKINISSDKGESFEGEFTTGAQKKKISITADMVDIRGV